MLELLGSDAFAQSPKLVTPMRTLVECLTELLNRVDMEGELEFWKSADLTEGVYEDVMDGNIRKSLKGPNGKPFFSVNNTTGEIRIGLTLGLDW